MHSIVLDTHATVWMLLDDPRLSVTARRTITATADSGHFVHVPVISVVEIVYLVEKNRLHAAVLDELIKAIENPGSILPASMDMAVSKACAGIPRRSIPDMPDRIIAATAVALSLPLIRRDRKIRAANLETIW